MLPAGTLREQNSKLSTSFRCAVNIQHLRQSVKAQWLDYYRENRDWLSKLGVWVTCEGKRRPSSGFILATLTTLEPQLTQLLPLIVDLTGNPDRIIMALGLNFNPDDELKDIARAEEKAAANGKTKMLPAKPSFVEVVIARPPKPMAKPEPVAVAKTTQPPRNQPVQEPVQQPIQPQPELKSPFVAPATPFEADEPAVIEPKASASPASAPEKPIVTKPTLTPPIVRPAMDTEDLAAEELPKRDAKKTTASKQNVRSNPVVKTRWD